MQFLDPSTLTIKSLQIESQIRCGNTDGFTYKCLRVPVLGALSVLIIYGELII